MPTPVEDVAVLSSEVHHQAVPHEQFAWLRAERPVAYLTTGDPHLVQNAWVVTRHADVVKLDMDEEHLTAAPGHTLHRRPIFQEPHLLNTDGADHARLRRLVSRGFTPRVVRAFEAYIGDLVVGILDEALPLGTFDFVDQVAADLPVHAICHLMGAPVEDRSFILACANALAGDSDAEYMGADAGRLVVSANGCALHNRAAH